MEMTKPPVVMTIEQMFERLVVILERATLEEQNQLKEAWLEGAERMNRETARLREERLSR